MPNKSFEKQIWCWSSFVIFAFVAPLGMLMAEVTNSNAKGALGPRPDLVVQVQSGESDSLISIASTGEFSVLSPKDSHRGKLSDKNQRFLERLATEFLSEKSSAIEACPRSFIRVTKHGDHLNREGVACLGSKGRLTKKGMKLLDALTLI